MCLKRPYAKYKLKEDLEKAMLRVDFKTLAISTKWPQSIQGIMEMERGLSRDLWARPTLREVCKVLDDCASSAEVKDCESRSGSGRSLSLSRRRSITISYSLLSLSKMSHFRLSETSGTTVATTFEEISSQDGNDSRL